MTIPSSTDLSAFGALVLAVQRDPVGAALNLYRYAKAFGPPPTSPTVKAGRQ